MAGETPACNKCGLTGTLGTMTHGLRRRFTAGSGFSVTALEWTLPVLLQNSDMVTALETGYAARNWFLLPDCPDVPPPNDGEVLVVGDLSVVIHLMLTPQCSPAGRLVQ